MYVGRDFSGGRLGEKRQLFSSLLPGKAGETKAAPWCHSKGYSGVKFKGKKPFIDANGITPWFPFRSPYIMQLKDSQWDLIQ